MGDCQNVAPSLGSLNIRGGHPKGTLALTPTTSRISRAATAGEAKQVRVLL